MLLAVLYKLNIDLSVAQYDITGEGKSVNGPTENRLNIAPGKHYLFILISIGLLTTQHCNPFLNFLQIKEASYFPYNPHPVITFVEQQLSSACKYFHH